MIGSEKLRSLTIVIPAYNESGRILNNLRMIDEYISQKSDEISRYVLIVNDGSSDDTESVVTGWIMNSCKNKNKFRIHSYSPNKGKGNAVKEGFLRADTDLVMYTDADGASPIEEHERLLKPINEGCDVACGSRILKGDEVKVRIGFVRRLTGLIFHLVLRFLGLADIKDTQCGFKLFKTTVAKLLLEHQQCINYAFDVEYLFLAKKFKYKIKEVPVNWYHVEGSKISLLRDSIKMLVEVLKIRFIYKYNLH